MKRRRFSRMRLTLASVTVLALAAAHGVFAQNRTDGHPFGNLNVGCTVNGKYIKSCTAGQQKQAARELSRKSAASQQKGVSLRLAGLSLATASQSPLAPVTALGAGATVATPVIGKKTASLSTPGLAATGATLAFGTAPDYFAVGNYANSPLPVFAAGVITGGMRKFVNTLPGLCGVTAPDPILNQCIPLAQPDPVVTYSNSDFYRIGLKEYTKQMHSDLPSTPLRGYFDAVADPTGANPQYLGPLILATRNRATRVLFTNQISTDLNIPVDTTYMGAGAVSDGVHSTPLSSSRRATLHLHGGNTPWISDGTTHQWITPANDPQNASLPFQGFAKGFSAMNVPDMNNVLPSPSLTDGKQTFYWTNQQSGRLMFFHDHAYGITRLNVYAGEAAGYLLVDPTQENGLKTATAPGTIVTNPGTGAIVSADLTHMFPLVIQDKTFVPDPAQLAAQDPTWDTAAGGGLGNLWFPHVYMPNQNPADVTGANGFGRWDYGPWFWPPQNPSTFVPTGQPYQCTSAAAPAAGWAFPPLMCPGTPLPSGTPESFMDTPVVNGTAYPKLQVAPAAYRFQVLNASNDRGLNLGLYVAEPVTLSPIITSPGSGYANPKVTLGGCTGGSATAHVGNGIDPVTGLPFSSGIVGISMNLQPLGCANPTITISDTPGTGTPAGTIVQVGNALTARSYATDWVPPGTLGPLFVIVHATMPASGIVQNIQYFNQATTGGSPYPSAGHLFNAYILRPTGSPNQYLVLWDSGQQTIPTAVSPTGDIITIPVPNVRVTTGDVLAFYGSGIPLDINLGTDNIYVPAFSAPVSGAVITAGDVATFPVYPEIRSYSISATVLDTSASVLTATVGNPIVSRGFATDFVPPGTSGPILVVVRTTMPASGIVQSIQYFNQATTGGSPYPSAGHIFNAYILRPTGVPNQYSVLWDSGPHTVPAAVNPAGDIISIAVPNVSVSNGDAIAFYGSGIPLDPGVGTDSIYVPAFTAPVLGSVITVGDPTTYVLYPQVRTYSIGAKVLDVSTVGGSGSGAAASVVISNNTDVHMVPAVSATSGRALPNCPQSAPMAGGGQVTALFDAAGNPLNGTGLPPNCWPLYSSAQGYTAGNFGENGGQLSWGNSDGRMEGLPDPLTAGPPIIQVGAEGGVLPKLAVIPSTPVSYDYNKRSITVLNVLNHGLWLGPAERADIIVDFSAFAGKTLILYNDAPAPIPAGDPRIDYYTNNPDMSPSGGATSTIAGYGPNTRTIMQISVTGSNPNTTPFSLPALSAALPNIFAATQDHVIIPEPDYPPANGQGPATYVPIQATSINAWIGGGIGTLTLTNAGAGYTAAPVITFTGGGGSGAAATATLAPAGVASVNLQNTGGFGYTTTPGVVLTGGGGTGASATAVLGNQGVRSVTMTNAGSGYTGTLTVTVAPPGCTPGPTCARATATASAQLTGSRRITSVSITNPGMGYTTPPAITITGTTGSGFAGTGNLGSRVTGFTVTAGTGYTSAPSVSVAAPLSSNCVPATLCTAATATSTLAGRSVASITVTNAGTGYTSPPAVTFTPSPLGAASTATATVSAAAFPVLPKTIQELFTLDYGRMNATLGVELPFTNFLTQTTIPYGYADPPTEIFKDGETQVWKITHNGVDTHFIHFHLFTVQVINRVGWDGAIKPPDPYELGMKDTVRMNPLEDIIVALRPFKQTLPFAVPNSSRPMDVVQPIGFTSTTEFTNLDPQNNPATIANDKINFGWEYVWHCHILGHEENDMMRAMILAVAPGTPTASAVTGASAGTITLTMSVPTGVPNQGDPTGFTIQRATAAGGPFTTVAVVPATFGAGTATASFTDTGLTSSVRYFYQVLASNVVGYTQTFAAPAVGWPHPSADSAPVAVNAVAR